VFYLAFLHRPCSRELTLFFFLFSHLFPRTVFSTSPTPSLPNLSYTWCCPSHRWTHPVFLCDFFSISSTKDTPLLLFLPLRHLLLMASIHQSLCSLLTVFRFDPSSLGIAFLLITSRIQPPFLPKPFLRARLSSTHLKAFLLPLVSQFFFFFLDGAPSKLTLQPKLSWTSGPHSPRSPPLLLVPLTLTSIDLLYSSEFLTYVKKLSMFTSLLPPDFPLTETVGSVDPPYCYESLFFLVLVAESSLSPMLPCHLFPPPPPIMRDFPQYHVSFLFFQAQRNPPFSSPLFVSPAPLLHLPVWPRMGSLAIFADTHPFSLIFSLRLLFLI